MYHVVRKFIDSDVQETVHEEFICEAVKAFNESCADTVELIDGETGEVLVLKDGRGIRWNELDIM